MPIQTENIPPIHNGVIAKSNQIGCDNIDNEIDSPQWHLSKNSSQLREVHNTGHIKDLCHTEKLLGEDDEDSGIELGPSSLPLREQEDKRVLGKLDD